MMLQSLMLHMLVVKFDKAVNKFATNFSIIFLVHIFAVCWQVKPKS